MSDEQSGRLATSCAPKTWMPELRAIPPVRAMSEDRQRGEPEGPVPGAGIGVAEPGEDQGQEGGGEGGPVSGSGFLRRLLHRG